MNEGTKGMKGEERKIEELESKHQLVHLCFARAHLF